MTKYFKALDSIEKSLGKLSEDDLIDNLIRNFPTIIEISEARKIVRAYLKKQGR